MVLLRVAFTPFHNMHSPSFSNKTHVGIQVLTVFFGPLLLNILHTCKTICPLSPISLLMMSFMGIYLLIINSARSMFGSFQCMFLIQTYQMVKSFPAVNQSPGPASSLGVIILITVATLWYWTLSQGMFPLSITWRLMMLEVDKYAPDDIPKWRRVNKRFPALYKALLVEPDAATRGAKLRQAVSASGWR